MSTLSTERGSKSPERAPLTLTSNSQRSLPTRLPVLDSEKGEKWRRREGAAHGGNSVRHGRVLQASGFEMKSIDKGKRSVTEKQ
ncbi:hypothetical protein SDJN03_01348, partial [Cucurbita argyrosperma subsp. sororia]